MQMITEIMWNNTIKHNQGRVNLKNDWSNNYDIEKG